MSRTTLAITGPAARPLAPVRAACRRTAAVVCSASADNTAAATRRQLLAGVAAAGCLAQLPAGAAEEGYTTLLGERAALTP